MSSEFIELTGEPALLALASVDMRQAAAAARLLESRVELKEARALEAAIAVCYWRPFSARNLKGRLRKKWRPTDERGREIHSYLRGLRNTVYAHTDPSGGRVVGMTYTRDDDGTLAPLSVEELSRTFPRDRLPAIIETCEAQADRFLNAALHAGLRDAASQLETPADELPHPRSPHNGG